MASKRTVLQQTLDVWGNYFWPVVRQLILPVVIIAAIIIGMAAGYTVLGKQPLSDVWKIDTWKHLYDLVFSDT